MSVSLAGLRKYVPMCFNFEHKQDDVSYVMCCIDGYTVVLREIPEKNI